MLTQPKMYYYPHELPNETQPTIKLHFINTDMNINYINPHITYFYYHKIKFVNGKYDYLYVLDGFQDRIINLIVSKEL